MFDLEKAKVSGNYRVLRRANAVGNRIFLDEHSNLNGGLLNLASNDYLGIASDIELRDEFLHALLEHSNLNAFFGSGASRLVYGSSEEFERLEAWFEARFAPKKALVFNSGYAANLGAISALGGAGTLFLADKLIHASMIDALRISGADFRRYPHGDYATLARLLDEHAGRYERVIILTEAVFSMDGDRADIEGLVRLKKSHKNVLLYLDEAHSFFALEPLGRAHALGLEREIDFMLVTLSKALGGSGAVFLCDELTREILVNSARSLIYSTALPSVSVAWTNFILERDFSARRSNLKANIDFMGLSDTQICPFIVGENEAALSLAAALRTEGYFVAAIRPPTVPEHTARLRISLRGDVETSALERLKEILDENRVA